MDLGLADRVAVITGGASGGLGETIAVRLLEERARVLAVDLETDASGALIERLSRVGDAAGHVADLSSPDFGAGVLAAATNAFGGVDIVVNNAAVYPSKPWSEFDAEEFSSVLDTNLRSMFLMAKATVPSMAARDGGSIVNIGSISFLRGMANLLPYVASKGGNRRPDARACARGRRRSDPGQHRRAGRVPDRRRDDPPRPRGLQPLRDRAAVPQAPWLARRARRRCRVPGQRPRFIRHRPDGLRRRRLDALVGRTTDRIRWPVRMTGARGSALLITTRTSPQSKGETVDQNETSPDTKARRKRPLALALSAPVQPSRRT